MTRDDHDRRRRGDASSTQRLDRQNAFRGEMGTVCANAATNTPAACGAEQPVIDAEGRPLHEPSPPVSSDAPTKH